LLVPKVLQVDVNPVGALVVDLLERLKPGLVVLLLLLSALFYLLIILFLASEELPHSVALLLDPLRLGKDLVRMVSERLLLLFYLIGLKLLMVPEALLYVVELSFDLVLFCLGRVGERDCRLPWQPCRHRLTCHASPFDARCPS
jgi:hypothetical protein